jgi:ADP-ribosyl-[dinitrogen reductase] hydrolase
MNPGDCAKEARLRSCLAGALWGTAVGDSIGLPAEGLSRSRINRQWKGTWRQRLLFGRGMISDDTEHSLFVAQSLLSYPDDATKFQKCLAWKLRLWLLGLPAGIGFATLRAILKLWLGFPAHRAGVYSAGNGPAMRSAIIGAFFFDDAAKRRAFVSASARLTHSDPRAETAALAVAEAAAWAVRGNSSTEDFVKELPRLGSDAEWQSLCTAIREACHASKSVASFAESLGLSERVTGYAYHSVPVALYAWLASPNNFRMALESALNCGGDTDTVGAMVGALAGISAGVDDIPREWLGRLCEWPRCVKLLQQVAHRLGRQNSSKRALGPVRYFWPALLPRNLVFLVTILAHGFRRIGFLSPRKKF